MTIEWLAGNRIRGTTAERPNASLPSGSVGGWKEVGRTTVASNGDSLDVSSLTDKRYYMVLLDHQASGSSQPNGRFNSDSGSNYCYRFDNDGSNGTGVNKTNMKTANGWNTSEYGVWYISNLAGKQKASFYQCSTDRGSGAGTAPSRSMTANMWTNTSNAINAINFQQGGGGGSFKAGSECVVLGYDPADTHTDNFWQELDSVTLTDSSDNLDSNTFDAKKYLWVQMYLRWNGTASDARINFNDDTGNNYARRYSQNGGADNTQINQSYFDAVASTVSHSMLVNMFIVNVSSREKFIICDSAGQMSSGASNAPDRRVQQAGKWANTSAQITSIDVFTEVTASTFNAGSTLKVWGSD